MIKDHVPLIYFYSYCTGVLISIGSFLFQVTSGLYIGQSYIGRLCPRPVRDFHLFGSYDPLTTYKHTPSN